MLSLNFRMAYIKSYIEIARLFLGGGSIYLKLRKELKRNYIDSLKFPDSLEKDYYYHSKFYNRTKQYIHANHFFGEFLCLVRGFNMTRNEMNHFLLLSSCAPIFDDFFEKNANYQSLKNLMHHPNIENANSDSEKLAAFFFGELLKDLNQPQELLNAADQLFAAQLKSKTQNNQHLIIDELLDISKEKGGYSGLMYALLLDGKKSDQFLELAFELGSYGQLMDDIFDVYDDAQEGIRTFANQAKSINEIRLVVEEHEQKVMDALEALHPESKNKKSFEQVLWVFGSVIEIALRKFEKNEVHFLVGPIKCLQLERKNWIIDMEKASNIWKLFKFSANRI